MAKRVKAVRVKVWSSHKYVWVGGKRLRRVKESCRIRAKPAPKIPLFTDTSRRWPNPVESSELDCLIRWQKGTLGERREMESLESLNALAVTYGYGWLSQTAKWLEELWRDPEGARKRFEKMKREHFKRMGWPPEKKS